MNILDLPDWDVLQRDEKDDEYMVAAQVKGLPRACPGCGTINPPLYRFGQRPIVLMDLPVHGRRVGIRAMRRRFRCRDCQHTFVEPLPDVDERHRATKRLVEWVAAQALSRTFTGIANEIGINEITVRRIFTEHVTRLNAAWEAGLTTPRVLGIDELQLAGGTRCIMTDVEASAAIDLLEKRDYDTVWRRLDRFQRKEQVEVVTIDMWRPYRDAARRIFPLAAIVVDKFHVERMATAGLDTVRKGLRERLTDRQRRQLKHDRFLLLSRPDRLKPEDHIVLDAWTLNFPELKRAYDLKEEFYRVYDAETKADGAKRLDEWLDAIPKELKPAFKPLVTAMGNWREEVLAYFDHRVTNAYTEGLNGLAKLANRQGRGYSFDAIRAKVLFHIGKARPKRDGYDRSWLPSRGGTRGVREDIMGFVALPDEWAGADLAPLAGPIDIPLDALVGRPFSTADDEEGEDEA